MLAAGVEFLPIAVAIVVAAHGGGHLISQFGAKAVIGTGLAVGAGGAFLLSGLPADGSYLADLLPGFLLLGVGGGLAAAGIALTLPVLSTIAASQSGLGAVAEGSSAAALTQGITSAFQAAAVIALAGVAVAATLLRHTDAIAGAIHMHMPH